VGENEGVVGGRGTGKGEGKGENEGNVRDGAARTQKNSSSGSSDSLQAMVEGRGRGPAIVEGKGHRLTPPALQSALPRPRSLAPSPLVIPLLWHVELPNQTGGALLDRPGRRIPAAAAAVSAHRPPARPPARPPCVCMIV
jgi:hypothetical protein